MTARYFVETSTPYRWSSGSHTRFTNEQGQPIRTIEEARDLARARAGGIGENEVVARYGISFAAAEDAPDIFEPLYEAGALDKPKVEPKPVVGAAPWRERPQYFTSGKATHDPHPWLHDHAAEGCRDYGDRMAANNGVGNVYDPRPEFDNHNPILVDFRSDVAGVPMGEQNQDPDDYRWLTGPDWENFWQDHVTAEHVNHARRVLEKLDAMTKEG